MSSKKPSNKIILKYENDESGKALFRIHAFINSAGKVYMNAYSDIFKISVNVDYNWSIGEYYEFDGNKFALNTRKNRFEIAANASVKPIAEPVFADSDKFDAEKCFICEVNAPASVALPCGHVTDCVKCAVKRCRNGRRCGICDRQVDKWIHNGLGGERGTKIDTSVRGELPPQPSIPDDPPTHPSIPDDPPRRRLANCSCVYYLCLGSCAESRAAKYESEYRNMLSLVKDMESRIKNTFSYMECHV